ncbi:haloacid dehalogenase [Leuconostoc citreum]
MTNQLYNQAQAFHRFFDDREPATPKKLQQADLINRVGFILEELTELAVSNCDKEEEIAQTFQEINRRLLAAKEKIMTKGMNQNDVIVQQADSLGDIIYLSFGSYVLMGVDPTEILDIIHNANMQKLFPDGTVHRDKVTNKVLKPVRWAEKYAPERQIKQVITTQWQS